MEIIFTLQSSSGVLGICCTNCKKLVNYAYTSDKEKMTMLCWSKDKTHLLCKDCYNTGKFQLGDFWVEGEDKLPRSRCIFLSRRAIASMNGENMFWYTGPDYDFKLYGNGKAFQYSDYLFDSSL